ncbi:MAG: DUF1705 domain-containing protein, partial [Magnetococcales bacterium]|nr:DUF1705 domain-containing protein [Magnetococcales bacterium]
MVAKPPGSLKREEATRASLLLRLSLATFIPLGIANTTIIDQITPHPPWDDYLFGMAGSLLITLSLTTLFLALLTLIPRLFPGIAPVFFAALALVTFLNIAWHIPLTRNLLDGLFSTDLAEVRAFLSPELILVLLLGAGLGLVSG